MSKKEKIRIIKETPTSEVWSTDDTEKLHIVYKDTIIDQKNNFNLSLDKKGQYCAKITARLFRYLSGYQINTYMINYIDSSKVLVHNAQDLNLYFKIINKGSNYIKKDFNVNDEEEISPPFLRMILKENGSEHFLDDHEFENRFEIENSTAPRIKQIFYKANAILKQYFLRRNLELYSIEIKLGLLDSKPVLIGDLSPDTFLLKNLENDEFYGLDAIIGDAPGSKFSYENVYRKVFNEEYQPEFERIKVQDEIVMRDEISEFEDELDLMNAENKEEGNQ